jgi:hypothetical protein
MADSKSGEVTVASSDHHEKSSDVKFPIATEHPVTIRDAMKGNATVMWWCFFFALSAIGW